MKHKLDECNIDAVCKEADAFFARKKTEPKDRIHTKLSIEEILLGYMGVFGNDAEFTVDYAGDLSKNKIRLTVPGKPVDPFSLGETESDDELYLGNVLARMGQRPKWKYARGVNMVIYTRRKNASPTGRGCWPRSLPPLCWD